MRPLLLDLFCGAGGCSEGYRRAGFDVIGVDIKPQPNYPFAFVQADAMTSLTRLLLGGPGATIIDMLGRHWSLSEFAAIHASPPCQRFTQASRLNRSADRHPDLIRPIRRLLKDSGKPFVIENVPGAPLVRPVTLCGLAFGLRVKRHRLFESNVAIAGTGCPRGHPGKWVTVFGGGAPAIPDTRRRAPAAVSRVAMGIDWMARDELSQAIPPAYTEFLGRQLLSLINTEPST